MKTPAWVKNFAGKILGAGYDATQSSDMRPMAYNRGARPVDEDNQIGSWDRARLRLECRDLRRNNPIVAGVCDRFSDNVVGPGVVPQAKTVDGKWNDAAEQFFGEWAKVADYRQRVSLRGLQKHIVQEWLVSGEMFFVLTDGGQLQPIEADRVISPPNKSQKEGVIDGIQISPTGIPIGYYVGSRDESGIVQPDSIEYIRRADMIHCYRPTRPDQLRGIPALAPIITSLRDHGMLIHSMLQRAKLEARPGLVIKSPEGARKMNNLGPRNATANSTQTQARTEYIDDAQLFYLKKDEDIFSPAMNTPNAQFGTFNDVILRLVSSALSLPYEFLLLYFSGGSFSSNKAALAQTYKTFLGLYTDLNECFNQRTWNWRIAKAIRAGALAAAPIDARGISEWYKVEWSQPDYTWIDPDAGADVAIKEWNLGVGSVTSFARKRGRDGEDVLAEKGRDIATAQRIADEVNKASGTNLTWRDLISTLQPGQTAPSSASDAPAKNINEEAIK